MERLLNNGIGWRHFQKRLKVAFEETASIEPVDIDVAGNTIQGERILVQPFVNDPLSRRFPAFREKTYIFILSDQVPGAFHQIITRVNDQESGLRIEERYLLAGE